MRNRTRGKVAADRDDFFACQLSAQFRIGMTREVSAQIFRIVALRNIRAQQALDGRRHFRSNATIAAETCNVLMFTDGTAKAEVIGVDQLVAELDFFSFKADIS